MQVLALGPLQPRGSAQRRHHPLNLGCSFLLSLTRGPAHSGILLTLSHWRASWTGHRHLPLGSFPVVGSKEEPRGQPRGPGKREGGWAASSRLPPQGRGSLSLAFPNRNSAQGSL